MSEGSESNGINGFRFTRATEGMPHVSRKPRAADDPDYVEHPAITRGLNLFRNAASGGAAAHTLLRTPTLDVSYAWFKSGFPLPLHSHDVDCYYLVIAGDMKVGTETLGKGDGVLIPAGAPYTVTPGEDGVEFIEMRTSPDYDTSYRAKSDTYWDQIAATLRERTGVWAKEEAPYGLIDTAGIRMANDLIALGAGFRRRILIEPGAGQVTAELEDDYHRMVVTLSHEGGVVTRVESAMKRAPWTACPGAMARLQETFTGVALADVARRGEKSTNCTHLHDLATFAAAHANSAAPIAYDLHVSVSADGTLEGRRTAHLRRDGVALLDWTLDGMRFVAPEALAGAGLMEIGAYIAAQDKPMAEAIRILRWAAIVALGRMMDMPANMSATTFAGGNCYNFQPERAADSFRKPGADVDFSTAGMEPLADRTEAF